MHHRTIFKDTFHAWRSRTPSRQAAAVAFFAVFSLAPLLILGLAVAAALLGEQAARGEVASQLTNLIGPTPAHVLQEMLRSAAFQASGGWATAVAVVTLVYTASSVFTQLQDSLNLIWVVPRSVAGTWKDDVRQRAASFLMVVVVGALLLVSVILTTAFSALSALLPAHLVTSLIALGVLVVMFAMMYRILPDTPVAWGDVWIGAAFTTVLFTLGKGVIGWYLGHFAVSSAYGPAGSLLAIMLFAYYSAQVFLFGAEFTRVYAERHGSRRGQPPAARLDVQPTLAENAQART
ncbi:MAG TPA: YihY/virulence factor BrkB family protein [Candidatus Xenobia bacterium]